jgi:Undecaprenyl-phosphate galactose phosphotransferase WbaP
MTTVQGVHHRDGVSSIFKIVMDRVGAFCALTLLSPVFLALALIVKRDGGPAFYSQRRIGQNGRPFKCWKFRSMVTNSAEVLSNLLQTSAEARAEWERDFKLKDDPRITRIGAFLRKTSLDELPQLWNVLVGEMSLVGPRPVTEPELKYYGAQVKDYYAARPGMTGLWQVSGRNDVSYAERVALDSYYVHNWSLLKDVGIMFKTVGVVLQKRGAY